MNVDQLPVIYASFCDEVCRIKQQYEHSKKTEDIAAGVRVLSENRDYHLFADSLLLLGESYIDSGDYPAGIACILSLAESFPQINNKTLLYLRLAEYHIEGGNTEEGMRYLVKLCTQTSHNYEEAIALQNMSCLWEKYKPLVAGIVPDSVAFTLPAQPIPPKKCSRSVEDILSSPKADLLTDLSVHLSEMTANGQYLYYLNKWERAVFYVDKLWMEVNSGGFERYIYYNGQHFSNVCSALVAMKATKVLAILGEITQQFPRKKVPKSLERIQAILDDREELVAGLDALDAKFYEYGEKELLDKLFEYIQENKTRFR